MKKLVAMAMAALAAVAMADVPSISNVKAQQRYPWNGLVDIDYTITGNTTGLNLSFSARDAETGETYTPKTFLSTPSSGAGTNRATWNPKADGYNIASTNIVVTVLLARTVVPPEPTGEHNMVQLWEGGPYWATTNIGAEEPWDSGYYFWWGDTVGYTRSGGTLNDDYYSGVTWVSSAGQQMSSSPFSSSSCPILAKDNSALQSAGWIDSTTNLVAVHDAAHVHWGGDWRMPTSVEIQALVDNCTTTWITTNGVPGRLVTGKGAYANRSIFLPAVGYGHYSDLDDTGSDGYYWSSTPYSDDSDYAWRLGFNSGYFGRSSYRGYRDYGRSVRPVRGFAE